MTVRLTCVDKYSRPEYEEIVDVFMLINGEYIKKGVCKPYRVADGKYYATVRLNEDVSAELYCYCRGLEKENDGYEFKGLDFYEDEIDGVRGRKLKSWIVDDSI